MTIQTQTLQKAPCLIAAVVIMAMPATVAFAATTETDKLTASDAAAGDWYGSAVSISGTTGLVGARFDTHSGRNKAGSAYLIDATDGTELFKLTASDARADDSFGVSVGIDGTTAIVGAMWDNRTSLTDAGSAYLFDVTDGSQIAKLTASDAATDDWFGISVGISGTTVIVGAIFDDDGGTDSGSAYLFDTTDSTELYKLTASDDAAGDEFGVAVGISGTIAIVGAWQDDYSSLTDAGSAYLFDTTDGSQLFKLTASDAAAGDGFGVKVDISGSIAIVGARMDDVTAGTDAGSAYLFDTTDGSQLFKLTASDGAAGDQFGQSVSISGTTAIVGARLVDQASPSLTDSGAAYLFNTTDGTQIAKLTASDAAAGDRFGTRVGISGTTTLVGATRVDLTNPTRTDAGAAYLFETDIGTSEIAKLTASDDAAGDWYGGSVAVSGATAIIGARQDDHGDPNLSNAGSVYLVDATDGTQLRKLTASDADDNDLFGASVAISNTNAIAIVGAMGDNRPGLIDAGSAYLFDTNDGTELYKLTASDAATGDRFGVSVGIDGNTAIIGADLDDDDGSSSGSAYLFDTTDGSQLFKLTADDGAGNDRFGHSVGISGTIAIVGARLADQVSPSLTDSGAAYLFDTTDGSQLFKLTASDAAAGDLFGVSVAIDGTIAIVGAREDDDNGLSSGSAYLFDVTDGSQLYKLTPSDGGAAQRFGQSVSISGKTAVIGAFFDDDKGAFSGSAYLFDTTDGTQIAKLTASDGAAGDRFGISVGISGGTTLVGAYLSDDGGADSGSAYLFGTATTSSLTSSSSPSISGGTIDFSDMTVDEKVNLDDIISLINTGDLGSVVDVQGFEISGIDAALFDLPTFAAATLTTASEEESLVAYDLAFLGADEGDYAAILTLNTDSGDVVYNLSATVVPEPGTGLLWLIGGAGALQWRRRSRQA